MSHFPHLIPNSRNLPNWHKEYRCSAYWITFQMRDMKGFRTYLSQWTDTNKALYPAIALAEMLTSGYAGEMAHASPDLVRFRQRYQMVESLLMGMDLPDRQEVLDMAAAYMGNTCVTDEVYALPLEDSGP